MKNMLLIDHILIAVSKKEFEKWKKIALIDERMRFKETVTPDWSWRGIYLFFSENFYLEIVEKNTYPARIGVAISSLGKEKYLLKDLKLNWPGSKFELESVDKDGSRWYDGYFCSSMESKNVFTWFMHYRGHFRKDRQDMIKLPHFVKSRIELNLSVKECNDFIEKIRFCGLSARKNKSKVTISDEYGRKFFVRIEDKPSTRVNVSSIKF